MNTAISHKSEKLYQLCQEYKVKKLYLFGSAVTSEFSPDSDLDFIVEFDRSGYAGAFDQYIDFKNKLEAIFERRVDLYHQKKFRNSIFQQEVDQSKELIYAA